MNRWTWFVAGTIALVPLIAWLDGFVMLGSQENYWHFLIISYAEAFCLAVGYTIGRSVKP